MNHRLLTRLESYRKQKDQRLHHTHQGLLPPLEEQGQKHWKAYSSILSVGDDKHYGYYEIRPADTVSQYIKHTGWHCDSFGDETCFGLVITLSRDKFAAGYANSNEFDRKTHSGTFCIAVDGIFGEAYEAAREGDRLAERYAEEARAADAEFQAERKIEEIRDEMKVLRNKASINLRALWTIHNDEENPVDFREDCLKSLRESIKARRSQTYEKWTKIRALRADPWSAVLD